jgi:hypothetical protein
MTLWTVQSVILSFSFFNFINFMYESNPDIGFYPDLDIKFWWIRVETGFSFEQSEWWVESLASLQKFYIWIQSGFSFYLDVLIWIKNTSESGYKPDFFFWAIRVTVFTRDEDLVLPEDPKAKWKLEDLFISDLDISFNE